MDHNCLPTGLRVYIFQEVINLFFNRIEALQAKGFMKLLIYFSFVHVPLTFGWIYYVIVWSVNRHATTTHIVHLSIFFWLFFAATVMARCAFENSRLESSDRPAFQEVFTDSMRRADDWKASSYAKLALAVVLGPLYLHIVILSNVRKCSNMVCQL